MGSNSVIIDKFTNIKTWKKGDERAPNKPLLVLYALAQFQSGQEYLAFRELDSKLSELLKEFGPERKSYHPEYPFWRLQNDGIWCLDNAEKVTARKSNTDAKKSELVKYNVRGYFAKPISSEFKKSPSLITDIARIVLSSNFPDTWHEDLIDAVGLDMDDVLIPSSRSKRDPNFRKKILIAYQHKCAVCGLSVLMEGLHPVLEAAHIKWHQAHGPDIEKNGIALCSIHHKLFDRGAYTLREDNTILVSENIYGDGLKDWLLDYHGAQLNRPIRSEYFPLSDYKKWHQKEVFRGKVRQL